MKTNPDWPFLQRVIENELLESVCWLPEHFEDSNLEPFMAHVSEQLIESMKRGDATITEVLILQLNCLKALHGIQLNQKRWDDFMKITSLVLKIGAACLL